MPGLAFLRHVLPLEGLYVAFARKGDQRHQSTFSTVETLYNWLLHYDAQGWEVYHACSSFRERLGEGMRAQTNVAWTKALWIDGDTRESHANASYEDRQAAYEAVQSFCARANLPIPTYVSSGGGLHAYWPLAEALVLDQWYVLASRFKALCHSYGLIIDPARTADASSVLRTPGTHHHKSGRVVECGDLVGPYPLEAFAVLEEMHVEPRRLTSTSLDRSPVARAMGQVYSDEPSDYRAIEKSCRQIGYFANSAGSYPEPFWYSACGLYGYCGDAGRERLYSLGTGYNGFGRDAVSVWIDGKINQWQSKTTGPATCARFEELNPGGCEGCPHRGEITSPIALGRGCRASEKPLNGHEASQEVRQALSQGPQIELPVLPPPWEWSETGQLQLMTEDKNGHSTPFVISEYPIFLAAVHRSETAGAVAYRFNQWLPHHGWRDIDMAAGRVLGPNGVNELHNSGANIRDPKEFIAYTKAAVDLWNRDNKMQTAYEQCGWKDQAFLVGTTMHTAGGTHEVAGSEELRARAKMGLCPSSSGDVRKWVGAVNKLINGIGHAGVFIILSAFAAPLMRLHTRHEGGAIVSGVNRASGTGKTTNLEIAASVYGSKRSLELASIDTKVSGGLTLAALGNLPVIFDEFALLANKQHPEAVRDFIMMFSNGRDKMRAEVHGKGIVHTQNTWQTLMLTASNQSTWDLLEVFGQGVDAPMYRVLEIRVDYPQRFDYAAGDRLKAELFENAGHAGPIYLQHLLQPAVMDFAKKALEQQTDLIWRSGFEQKHRFWVRTLGAVAVAGQLVRSLGLMNVDVESVIAYVIDELKSRTGMFLKPGDSPGEIAYENQEREAAVDILSDYLSHHNADTLVVRKAWKPGDMAIEPDQKPRNRLVIRYEVDTGRLMTPLREWRQFLIQRGFSPQEVQASLEKGKVLVDNRRSLTLSAGTRLPSAPTPCIVFDMTHPQVSLMVRELKSAV